MGWEENIKEFRSRVDKTRNLEKLEPIEISYGKNPSIYDISKAINHQKITRVHLRVLMWNMQTLNKEWNEANKKISYIREKIATINPEIIFLIDVKNRIDSLNLTNYRTINDGRNILAIRFDIKNEGILENGVFKIKGMDLNCAYIRPQEKNKELLDEVIKIIELGYTIIGDFNVRSNYRIQKAIGDSNVLGENSEQSIMIKTKGKNKSSVILNMAPSDHKCVLFNMVRRVIHSSQLKLESINAVETAKILRQIFTQGEYNGKIKVIQVKKLMPYNEEELLRDNIINDYVYNNTRNVFNKYRYLWKQFKKEPFLGTSIPLSVEETLKDHYGHKEDKIYKDIERKEIKVMLDTRKATHSTATNNEALILANIDKSLKVVWNETLEKGKQKEAIDNFINFCNNNKENLAYTTFFLIKNKLLLTHNDVRIISICPVHLKIWENIIYDRVVRYVANVIDKDIVYQYGGKPSGSTYEAYFNIRDKFQSNNGIGIVFADIVKGYDSVLWNILQEDIDELEDENVRNMLTIWLSLVENCDALANERRIRKTKGLGMGLALAPVMFELYTHRPIVISKIDRSLLSMYLDDLAFIIKNKIQCDMFVNLQKEFKKRNLIFNMKKSCLVCNDQEICQIFKDIGIETRKTEKYLGVNLGINANKEIVTDDRYIKLSENFACIPKMVSFSIRKRIIESAIISRTRYSTMMHCLKYDIEKRKILVFIWKTYKRDFGKLSYYQMFLFMFNFLKLLIDLNCLKQLKEKIKLCNEEIEKQTLIKKMLKFGHEQWDTVIEECDFEYTDMKNGINLYTLKIITNKWWKTIRNNALLLYNDRKKDEVINEDMLNNILDSKVFKEIKCVQELVLKRFTYKETTFLLFFVNVLITLVKYIQGSIEKIDKFPQIEFLFIDVNNPNVTKEMVEEIINTYIKFGCERIEQIIEQEDISKLKYRTCLKCLLIVDELYNWDKKLSLQDLLYKLDLKWQLQEEYLEKNALIICGENFDNYYNILEESPEELDNVISIDGSYCEEDESAGSGILVRKKVNNTFEEKGFYFSIPKSESDMRNVIGELYATLYAIQYAVVNKWNCVNLVFDYIGNCLFTKGVWKTNDVIINRIRERIMSLVSESNISINWLKVKSHSDIRINEMADILAKISIGIHLNDINGTRVNCPSIEE